MEILPQSFHGILDNARFVAFRPPQISKFDKLRDHLGGGNGPAKLNDDPHAVPQPARAFANPHNHLPRHGDK